MTEQLYDPAAHPYPAIRYHAEQGEKRVENAEEEAALGPGWIDTPNIPEGFLHDCGESSESRAQREDEVRQACEAFDQRLKKRASREAVKKDTPIWLIAIDSLEEELKELAFRDIEIYLKSWEKCDQSMDSQKDKWFREGLLEYILKDQLDKKLELLKQGYAKQLPSRKQADQRGEQWDKVGASVIHWAREQVGLGTTNTVPEPAPKPKQPASWLNFLRSKATFTMKEVAARIYGVDESTVRKTMIEPKGPLKMAGKMKRITGQSIADHLGVSLEDK